MNCGLIQMYGPKGWRKTVHVWMGRSKVCCCGRALLADTAKDGAASPFRRPALQSHEPGLFGHEYIAGDTPEDGAA